MEVALEEAREALAEGEVPVGAVVVHRGAVVFRSHNRREHLQDPTAHAEILALRGAGAVLRQWRLTGCVLYVTLEPCAMCMGAIVEARVRRLVFGASDRRCGAAGSLLNLAPMLGSRLEVIGGVYEEESEVLLQDFFRKRRADG
jgi:tRNA(adenine34) deaminase